MQELKTKSPMSNEKPSPMSFPTCLTCHSQLDWESILDSRFRENDKKGVLLFSDRLLKETYTPYQKDKSIDKEIMKCKIH
jgi:hypothetical protein